MKKLVAILILLCLLPSFVICVYGSEETKDEITIEDIVDYAEEFIGYKYVYGGTGPYYFDCSGFVQYVYGHFGYNVGRTSTNQYHAGEKIAFDDLEAGDILIFANTYERGISHSGIYIGNEEFIHAANSRKGVCKSKLEDYYKDHFYSGIRIIKEQQKKVNYEPIKETHILDENIIEELVEEAVIKRAFIKVNSLSLTSFVDETY